MTSAQKREGARRLRAEAEKIRQHGLSNLFEHTFTCIHYGQVPKDREEDRCVWCPVRPFVDPEFREEAFACQHVTANGWEKVIAQPEVAEQIITSFLRSAELLEAEADAGESGGGARPS